MTQLSLWDNGRAGGSLDCQATETAVGRGGSQQESQGLLPRGWGRDGGWSAFLGADQPPVTGIKDPALISLPGIFELSSDRGNISWYSEKSFLNPPGPVSYYKTVSELCLIYVFFFLSDFYL